MLTNRWKVTTCFDGSVQTLSFPFEHEAVAYLNAVLNARECIYSKIERNDISR